MTAPPVSDRLDQVLAARGLARSRTQAHRLIRSGAVRVDGAVVTRPSTVVGPDALVEAESDRYVSRAAYKLTGALDALDLTPRGRALDAGSSTGGFTQVLLERGCDAVVAVDVGTDQLHPSLRGDGRITLHEQTHLRDLTLDHVGGRPVDLAVADVSFISLVPLIAPITAVVDPQGWLLLLVKPQFEVGRERLGRGGVVTDPALHRAAVDRVAAALAEHGWRVVAEVPSALPGANGNQEYFVRCAR